MNAFRAMLALMLVAIMLYTGAVVLRDGFDLFSPFFGDIKKMGWPGQFNFDFTMMLALSALWVAWRHKFAPGGIALGVVAFFGGIVFLAVYLLVVSFQVKGDVSKMLVGDSRTMN